MNCSESRTLLELKFNKELSPSQKQQLELHLEECGTCAGEHDTLAQTVTAFKGFAGISPGTNQDKMAWEKIEQRLGRSRQTTAPVTSMPTQAPTIGAGVGYGKGTRLPALVLFAVAACILVAAGIWLLPKLFRHPGPEVENADIAVPSAKNEFYVLRTEPGKNSAIVQKFNNFLVTRLQVNDGIGGCVLKSVEEDALNLADDQGVILRLLVKDINKNANAKLQQEVSALVDRNNAGLLTGEDLERLGMIAIYGDPRALKVIQVLAKSSGSLDQRAEEILNSNRQAVQIRQFIVMAQDGKPETRRNAIRVLSEVESPLALKCLKEIALDSSEPLASYVVTMLGQQKHNYALSTLSTIAEQAGSEKLRRLTKAMIDQLLEEIGE
ncbi:anti-sigma factor family protein [Planctomycetota bacterium]